MQPKQKDIHPRAVTGLWRILYIGLGLFFVGMAVLGAMLPVLPTTPFLLLASYFFVRSSERLHRWLLESRLFGPMLQDWHRHRAVRPRVKILALSMLVIAVLCSAILGRLRWELVLMLVGLASIGAVVVIRLPVIRESVDSSAEPEQV